MFIAFLPQFQSYRDELKGRRDLSEEERYIIPTVDSVIDYIRKDYRATVASIENLTSHGEIKYDLLYAILVPRTIIVTTCPSTGELQALQLVSATKVCTPGGSLYTLICEGLDVQDSEDPATKSFFRFQTRLIIPEFKGTVKINSLEAYPIQYHPFESELKKTLIERGRKWANLTGIHHMSYKGTAAFKCQGKIVKYNVSVLTCLDFMAY